MAFSVSLVENSGQVPSNCPFAGSKVFRIPQLLIIESSWKESTCYLKSLARTCFDPFSVDKTILLEKRLIVELETKLLSIMKLKAAHRTKTDRTRTEGIVELDMAYLLAAILVRYGDGRRAPVMTLKRGAFII